MARLNMYLPENIKGMVTKLKQETTLTERDLVIIAIRQFYRAMSVDNIESAPEKIGIDNRSEHDRL